MGRKVKIGLIQTGVKLGDIKYNIENAVKMISKAAEDGANIVCLPELFATGYNLNVLGTKITSLIEDHEEYINAEMGKAAKENGVYVIAPAGETRGIPGVVYNSALVYSDEGEYMGSFAKSHLWAGERFHFCEGNDYPVFDTKYGRFGIIICYDVGFPETARIMMLEGAELLFVPSAWRIEDVDMWDLNLPQRALENLFFTVGVNLVDNEQGMKLFGKSKVCNPRGTVIKELPLNEANAYAVVEIDLDDVRRQREEIPYLKDRKPFLYSRIVEID